MRNWTRRTISSLLLCRKLHFFLGKSTKTAATRAALFDSSMHQIVCRQGLCPRPHSGRLQRSPRPLAVFRWHTSKRRGGREFVLCCRKKKNSRRLRRSVWFQKLILNQLDVSTTRRGAVDSRHLRLTYSQLTYLVWLPANLPVLINCFA